MKPVYLKNISNKRLNKIKMRSFGKRSDIIPVVQRIVSNIKKNGDAVIIKKYQKRCGSGYKIEVTKEEIEQAYKKVDKAFFQATKQAIKNITIVCKRQRETLGDKPVETDEGIFVWSEFRPVEKVGLYIPGGKAVYPSSVLMTGIPPQIADCKEIVLCSPPDSMRNIPAPTLVAADMIGIRKIFKVGGAEAIAAMAYGTKTIPAVCKIYGAGNSFVTEAKIQVFGKVAIDMPAGPSEIFIIADETANPKFIAADLLADGEHGQDSACVLITNSKKIADQTAKEIEVQIKKLATRERTEKALKNYGLLAVVEDMNEAINFCNDYAPEHLEIMTQYPEQVTEKIINAGSVFLGDWTTKSAGDYATGANHVLPTGGMAKMFAPLSVESFGKKVQFQKVVSKKALGRIRKTLEIFGNVEQLPAHRNSVTIRFE